MNPTDSEYPDVTDCVRGKLTDDLFFYMFVISVGLWVCTSCLNPTFPKVQEMEHIKPSLPQFLHPLMCVFSVSSTVISAVPVALGSTESLTYWEELLVQYFLSLARSQFLSLSLSVCHLVCIHIFVNLSICAFLNFSPSPSLIFSFSQAVRPILFSSR